jgi:hypothetical protein
MTGSFIDAYSFNLCHCLLCSGRESGAAETNLFQHSSIQQDLRSCTGGLSGTAITISLHCQQQ